MASSRSTGRSYLPDAEHPHSAFRSRLCPSCLIRYTIRQPERHYNARTTDRAEVEFWQQAAALFDEESDERFSASEFVAWALPDLIVS